MGSETAVNIFCPKLSRELIILQLNIHIIPSGRDSFLPLSERNERFIAGQLIAVAELGQKKKKSSVVFFFVPAVLGAHKARDCNRPVKCLQRGATEEEKQEIRQGEKEIRGKDGGTKAGGCY